MKLYLTVDMEGATAVVGGWDETSPGGREFEHARKMMTGDINACAKGAFEAGATDIVAIDFHGMSMTVDPVGVDPNVRLIRGRANHVAGNLPGLDETFDAMIILCMHAMEGTRDGVMNSTCVGTMRVRINGTEVGETGVYSAIAAERGVPTIMVTGDEAVAREAKAIIPGVYTVAVKKGVSRYSAEVIPPERAWAMITETTKEAVKNYKKVSLYLPTPPVEVRVEYPGNTQLVDLIAQIPHVQRVDGNTLSYTSDTVDEGMRALTHITSWMLGDHLML